MSTWTNDDGLTILSGTDEARKARVGETFTDGPLHVVEININFDNLPAVADNSVVIDENFKLPAGVVIESVELSSDVTFVGSGATFNVGITDADGGSTLTDVDALVTEATITELNAGGVGASGTFAGASVGTALAEAVLLTWEVNTAAITAGNGVVRVKYSVPNPSTDTLGT